MFKKMDIKGKLVILSLLVGLIPVLIVAFLSYQRSAAKMRGEAFDAVGMFLQSEEENLNNFFLQLEKDTAVLALTRDVYRSLNIFKRS